VAAGKGGSGERQVVAKCVCGLMAVIDDSRWAQATQCMCLYEWGCVRSRQGDGEWRVMRVGQRGCCCLWVLFAMCVICVCAMCVRGQSEVQQHRCRRSERSGPTSGRTDGPADVGVGVRR
jgi:hypothetical protein